jgi:hypothetical protein
MQPHRKYKKKGGKSQKGAPDRQTGEKTLKKLLDKTFIWYTRRVYAREKTPRKNKAPPGIESVRC